MIDRAVRCLHVNGAVLTDFQQTIRETAIGVLTYSDEAFANSHGDG